MPGIVGIIGTRALTEQPGTLDRMLKCMLHEPFYRSGKYVNAELGLQIGWVTHPGCFSDCMPVWNERRDVCLLFQGELFPDPAEIEQLKAKGHQIDGNNAAYIVHLYEELGPAFVEKLNGWFTGVIIDLRTRSTLLFNDRFALRRVYLHEGSDGLYFSTEAKSLLKVLPSLRTLDPAGLGGFLTSGCTLQEHTLYKDMSCLPGASRWTFTPGKPARREVYFKRETWEAQERLSPADYYETLKQTFVRILPRYFRGAETMGFSLTGGVDTRLILALGPNDPGKLRCFTFCGPYRHNTDAKLAQKVARICQQPHEVFQLNGDFLTQFPALAEKSVYVTDGVLDVTGAADLYINRLVRQISPVRLTGNYGGEILRSLVAFKPVRLIDDLFTADMHEQMDQATQAYLQERKASHPVSFVAFKQMPWHHYSRFSLEQSQLTHRSPYLDNEIVSLIYRGEPGSPTDNYLSLRLIADGNPALARLGTDRGVRYQPIPLISRAMRGYQYFTFKADYAYDYGMPQWMTRIDRFMAPLHLERMFLGRHKVAHFRVWYRDQLASYVRSVLLDPRALQRPYLKPGRLERIVQLHTSGAGNYTLELHRLLTLELLQRTLIEAA